MTLANEVLDKLIELKVTTDGKTIILKKTSGMRTVTGDNFKILIDNPNWTSIMNVIKGKGKVKPFAFKEKSGKRWNVSSEDDMVIFTNIKLKVKFELDPKTILGELA